MDDALDSYSCKYCYGLIIYKLVLKIYENVLTLSVLFSSFIKLLKFISDNN
jgi:hypothetical protein